ncbi:unnamed protein product [Vitrella brassicaformis CCMP3155]|uniref:Uncharacterized protein n=1 Tax=Vitrella brassicaformis (strain CCMP3155) TaxID=1169540 RepID=A0A0G4EQP6_VITBC|nr:unnamed protein product [Vitrella brassicaformis CCMP3155]|eukprot:CEL99563.1 unnamed protein product [Vitrella brassicaformis CCMP3155]
MAANTLCCPVLQEILKLCRVNSELKQELKAMKDDNQNLLDKVQVLVRPGYNASINGPNSEVGEQNERRRYIYKAQSDLLGPCEQAFPVFNPAVKCERLRHQDHHCRQPPYKFNKLPPDIQGGARGLLEGSVLQLRAAGPSWQCVLAPPGPSPSPPPPAPCPLWGLGEPL